MSGQRKEKACLKFSQAEGVKLVLVDVDDSWYGRPKKIQSIQEYRQYFQRPNKRIISEIK